MIARAIQQAKAFAEQGDNLFVGDNIAKAKKRDKKARERKPNSTNPETRQKQIEDINKEREAAKAELDFWNEVQATIDEANMAKQALQNEALQQFKDKVEELKLSQSISLQELVNRQ